MASLLSPQQEVQKIFKAKHPMDIDVAKAKVRVCRHEAAVCEDTTEPVSMNDSVGFSTDFGWYCSTFTPLLY